MSLRYLVEFEICIVEMHAYIITQLYWSHQSC